MQSCLTSEWLECLGCIHSLGWSWHQTGTFGAQDLFLKIMLSPWILMWFQTYVRPKQEAGLIIVIGVQVVPYQGPPLQHLGFNFLLSAHFPNIQSHFFWDNLIFKLNFKSKETLARSWHSEAVILSDTTLAPVQNT